MTDTKGQKDESTKLQQRERLSPNTWVPLGAVVAIVLSLVTGTWYVSQRWAILETTLRLMDTRFLAIEAQLSDIKAQLNQGSDDRWRRVDMRSWGERLGELNPDLKIPRVQ